MVGIMAADCSRTCCASDVLGIALAISEGDSIREIFIFFAVAGELWWSSKREEGDIRSGMNSLARLAVADGREESSWRIESELELAAVA